jgi:hypothetical protein
MNWWPRNGEGKGFAMRSRKLRWVVGGLALFAVGAFVLWPQPNSITQENCNRIREGMSRAEVAAILGVPSGDYRTGPTLIDQGWWNWQRYQSTCRSVGGTAECWRTDDMWLLDDYNGADEVARESHCTDQRLKVNLFENIRWRAKRQWDRWFPEQ